MNSNVKIVLALAAIVVAISGITVISNYTRTEDPTPVDPVKGDPETGGADPAEVVRYSGAMQVFYNPKSDNPTLRDFPGFFEVNDTEHPVIYWVQNPNPVPVEASALSRSCSACTNVRMAIFPAEPRRPEVEAAAAAALGGAGAEAVPFADRARRLRDYPADQWKLLDFEKTEIVHTIPPAAADGTPTWVAVQVNFKVRTKGPKEIRATIGFKTPKQKVPLSADFKVNFVGMPLSGATPAALDFGEMGESIPSKSVDLYYWTSIVPDGEFPPPEFSAGEPFLTFSKPERMTESERNILAGRMTGGEGPIRVRSAYRIAVTLHRKNPAPKPGESPELDIGPLEKTFAVFSSARGREESDVPRIAVKATVTGLVSLRNAGTINLGSFISREGISKPFELISNNKNVELEVAEDLIEPKILKAQLEAPKDEEGGRTWRLKVRIEGGATTGNLPADSAVVLRVKSTGQLVRLPAKGHALVR
jgi:hypothetical protein